MPIFPKNMLTPEEEKKLIEKINKTPPGPLFPLPNENEGIIEKHHEAMMQLKEQRMQLEVAKLQHEYAISTKPKIEVLPPSKDDMIDALGVMGFDTHTGPKGSKGYPMPPEVSRAYEIGPWIIHMSPSIPTKQGFQKAYVCPHCMSIGGKDYKSDLCFLCGYEGKKQIVAKWIRKAWHSPRQGHWEPRTNA